MSQVTLPSSWALLLGACAERWGPSCSFFPSSFGQPEMPPDAGHDGRESAPATIPVCYVFPAPQTALPCFCQTWQWQARPFGGKCRRRNTRDRKPCPHDNDGHGTSVTAAGKQSFPLPVAPPFPLPRGALRHPTYFLLFLSASPRIWPMLPCRHSRRHQVSFSLQGQR